MRPAARAGLDTDRVAAVRRAVRVLAEHGDDGVVAVASAMAIWLDQDPAQTITLDAALGLSPNWRAILRRQQRDQALLQLWRGHFAGLHGREAADRIAAVLHRYETTSWLRDRRTKGRRPDGLSGELFDVLTLGDVPGAETLRRMFVPEAG